MSHVSPSAANLKLEKTANNRDNTVSSPFSKLTTDNQYEPPVYMDSSEGA
jgi:hypothetical protein